MNSPGSSQTTNVHGFGASDHRFVGSTDVKPAVDPYAYRKASRAAKQAEARLATLTRDHECAFDPADPWGSCTHPLHLGGAA